MTENSSGKPLEGTYYSSTASTCGVILIGFFEQTEEENKKKGKESNLFVFGSRKNWYGSLHSLLQIISVGFSIHSSHPFFFVHIISRENVLDKTRGLPPSFSSILDSCLWLSSFLSFSYWNKLKDCSGEKLKMSFLYSLLFVLEQINYVRLIFGYMIILFDSSNSAIDLICLIIFIS